MKRFLSRVLVFAGLLHGLSLLAVETVEVAFMVRRPSNSLAWGPQPAETAFMLGCDALLRDFTRRSPRIRKVGPYRINGIVQAMDAGLYFPVGETLYAKWRPFLEADVYIEADFSRERLQWRAGTAAGDVYASPVIERPYDHPMASVAALVRLIFEASETEFPAAWEAELAWDEPSPPDLFVEWSKWIDYRPHWAHHAPWRASQESAMRILREDPDFAPGVAWALEMIMRDGSGFHHRQGEQPSPASLLQLPNALRLLDSPQAEAAFPFLRKFVPDSGLLPQVLGLFDLPMLGMDMAPPPATPMEGMGQMAAPIDFAEVKERFGGPRLRRNLALVIGRLKHDMVRDALQMLVQEDDDPEVRAAAVGQLAAHHADVAETVRQAFVADPAAAVRQEALAGLIVSGVASSADVARAAQDEAATVRATLVERLPEREMEADARRALWLRLLDDAAPAVRLACVRQLQRLPEMSAGEDGVREAARRMLTTGEVAERLAIVAWLVQRPVPFFAADLEALLDHETATLRATAAKALQRTAPERAPAVIEALRDDVSSPARTALAEALVSVGTPAARELLFEVLATARPDVRGALTSATYQMIGSDRSALARAMCFDPALTVNLAALRLLERLGDPDVSSEVLAWCVDEHPNPYIRAKALRDMERASLAGVRQRCLQAIHSPFWVVRLEAADILTRLAEPTDADVLRDALADMSNDWLRMALEDALAKAENRLPPERIRLGLGERRHTEGGEHPAGFQVWLGAMPREPEERRRMVDEGYRFGATTAPANMPAGMVLTAYNQSDGLRNIYLLESILDPLEKWQGQLPYMHYIALFDEPCTLGTGFHPDRVRAMVLEAGRPELLPAVEQNPEEGLPDDLRHAYAWYNARFGGVASNWVVHMFRLTAQRKYPDLQIFPQSLSYMGTHTRDAFEMIDADGDYTWRYHHQNFFGDGAIGAIHRVLNPGKPLNAITWLGWHRINPLRGNTLNMATEYPDQPWRLRGYMGSKSALALWATGTEAGFFTGVGFTKTSEPDARAYSPTRGAHGGVFDITPWSPEAHGAVEFMLDDPGYWRGREGIIALEQLKQSGKGQTVNMLPEDDPFGDDEDDALRLLEGGPTPLEKAMQAARDDMYDRLMVGISYMNIFATDVTRALSNLPKPDTSLRDTLLILGRDSPFNGDGSHVPMPAIALVQGFDMLPSYDGVGQADLLHYDTILLRASRDGVTADLVAGINRWLREKPGGLLIVWGDVTSDTVLFPDLTLDVIKEPFLWEGGVRVAVAEAVEETYRDHRGRDQSRRAAPRLEAFEGAEGRVVDEETRRHCTFSGAVEPLVKTLDGEALLARWQAPEGISSSVLFDGASEAGPVYTEALEKAVLAIDRERGSQVARNPWWGHTIYQTDEFVVDVATNGFRSLHAARPRRHRGVDIITGEVNPEVRHGECALVLLDYVGPYAGGRGDWAVMARSSLDEMTVHGPDRLSVTAQGVARVTRIGDEPIRLETPAGFVQVENQIRVWQRMREGQPAFSVNHVDGGRELHVFSPNPFSVVVGEP